jgi:selenocysteine lyase/cysteine desulfurase
MAVDWAAVRETFPIAERCVYLNTGWSGPSSRAVVRAMEERLEREAFEGPTSPEIRHEKALLVQRARRAFASVIGADEDEVALVYTTTEGVNTALRGLGLGAGDEVITCNLEHNSVMVPSYVSRLRDGVDVKVVRFASTETAAEMVAAFESAMTASTKLLVLSQISYNRGTRLPMREICSMAHARGALVCVDAAQSAGQIAIDVHAMGCDVMALPGHKWLLGPDGAAALYVRRDLIERVWPLAVVHGANRRYDYEGHFEYASDTIHKFELTTHSGPVLAGLCESVDMLLGIGMEAVGARCRELADRFVAGAEAIDGVRLTSPLDDSVRSGIVTFTVRDFSPHSVVDALWRLDRIVARVCNDRRARVCFHVFNDETDVDRALAALEHVASRGLPVGVQTEEEYKAWQLDGDD